MKLEFILTLSRDAPLTPCHIIASNNPTLQEKKPEELSVSVAQLSFLGSQDSNQQRDSGPEVASFANTTLCGGFHFPFCFPLILPNILPICLMSQGDCPEDKGKMPEKRWAEPCSLISKGAGHLPWFRDPGARDTLQHRQACKTESPRRGKNHFELNTALFLKPALQMRALRPRSKGKWLLSPWTEGVRLGRGQRS